MFVMSVGVVTRNNGYRLCVAGYTMTKKGLSKKRTAAEAAKEPTSASIDNQLMRGEGSKKGEDNPVRSHRTQWVGRGKGKDVAVDLGMGEMSIRHRCAFESICALTNDLVEI